MPVDGTVARRPSLAGSAEREAVGLGAGVEELDLEAAVVDRARLADQLIGALLVERPAAVARHVGPVRVRRRGWPSRNTRNGIGRPSRGRAHHEVDVARLELERDPAARLVRDRGVTRDRPRARERPRVERQRRRGVGVGPVERGDVVLREAAALAVADVRLGRCSVRQSAATSSPAARPSRGPGRRPSAPASSSSCWMTISVIAYSPSPKWWYRIRPSASAR